MSKLKVVKANLALRFYVSDGWTRKKVSELLKIDNISAVLPSYYDGEKHTEITKISNQFFMPIELNNVLYSDCDYFLVLAQSCEFDHNKLNEKANVVNPFVKTF